MNSNIKAGDNPILTEERNKCQFNTDILAGFYYENKEKVKRKRDIYQYYLQNPDLHDPEPPEFMDRYNRLENAERKVAILKKHLKKVVPTNDQEEVGWFLQNVFLVDGSPLGLHNSMMIPTILNNADEEQKAEWLPKAQKLEFIGTYAQTELGHGTNLRRLETTATFDPKSQEFILHSPTISATKWWPGYLGKVANVTVVVARLISDGKDYGPHTFFVTIRDPITHQSLPGIILGDIGPKFGINTVSNGFLIFNNVRIPRRNMFMKNAKLDPDGKYHPPKHAKLAYGTMVYVRATMIRTMSNLLGRAATIAVRYSAIRKQGEIEAGKGEVQILEYQTQQYRLLPQVARAWAFEFAGRYTRKMYEQFLGGDFEILPALHGITSGLKAVVTHQTALGIEQCRMACGGHGYSEASGLPQLFTYAVGGCTYEGENTVMLLQSARQLIKIVADIRQNHNPTKLNPITAYLYKSSSAKCQIDQDTDQFSGVIEAFEHVSRRLIFAAFDKLEQLKQRGISAKKAWAECGVDLRRAATAHTRTFIARQFVNGISEMKDLQVFAVLKDLLQLFLFYEILECAGDLLFDGYANGKQIDFTKNSIYQTLQKLRPNAVSIVDSFDFNDRELNSILGRRDGNVYENLLEWAKASPLNKHDVMPFHHKYLGKMMKEAVVFQKQSKL
uniref:Acyl-coenzyme A oxidase n=1 Tax=Panagrolaimus sp. ES5 TaxID=591445 RepID=A0AC34FUR3_9BILA